MKFLPVQHSGQIRIVTTIYLVVHAALFVHGIVRPESFMAGDRAGGRLKRIQYVFYGQEAQSADNLATKTKVDNNIDSSFFRRMLKSGDPGDYVFQGVLFFAGGAYLVIVFQLLLSYFSTICTYYLARLLGLPARLALFATILYIMLPGSLILPHELSSEAIYNPLVAIGIFFVVSNVEGRVSERALMFGICLLALAILVRPQLLFYPLVLVLIMGVFQCRNWRRNAFAIILICFLVPLGWGLFIFGKTGKYNLGGQHHGPGTAFFLTAKRMAVVGGSPFEESEFAGRKMSASDFSKLVVKHPDAFVKVKSSDLLNLIMNPGTYSLAAHHLGYLPPAGDTLFWAELRDQKGISGTITEIFRRGPKFIAVFVGGTLAWSVLLIGAAFGGVVFIRDPRSMMASKAILISYLFYGLLVVLVASAARWGHRTSVEFIIVILVAIAIEFAGEIRLTHHYQT